MGLFGRKGNKPSLSGASTHSTVSNGSSRSPAMSMSQSAHSRTSNPLPDITLPKAPDPNLDPVGYLRSIYAVRDRSKLVLEKAKKNQLKHFVVDLDKFADTAGYVVSIIKRDFAPDYSTIPPHGRWQHFEVGGRPRVDQLLASWSTQINAQERTRRLIDLFLVSVLLDAGAGTKWQYRSKESGKIYRRSEGLAIASLEMFKAGLFSSNVAVPHQVDSRGLRRLDVTAVARGLQVTDQNPINGLEGRTELLNRLADALQKQEVFGVEARPGNMLDYLLSHPSTQASSVPIIPVPTLWTVLMDSLGPIWPATRTRINGVSIGDAWPCSQMPSHPDRPWENILPFHKLTQWLAYSLMVPMSKLLNVRFAGVELMTGLPEYRNGGLLIDTGLLTLKDEDTKRGLENFAKNAQLKGQPSMEVVPLFPVDDDVIIEWRAVTVGFLDELLVEVNALLSLRGADALSLAQMLEAGTWKGGRELAEVSRPNTKEPPIMIVSDGTVF
ncbi:DUF1688-domain-containing protein [Pseudovirgaria hyperparasitica]|uniref:DUF1688-domain-containing protein n=1 Tax=Pseudovirgaria hyperparasitica TaxID=470096 RepID=A0A6A6VWC3_9PEZI|nr:DUF1688-domain-containing protein [Pseudovirgaria hyperparasitica]KAF2753940.1 DUF1688-domain-containing protein [Pseudovirgaria hyperparasitica]